MSTDVNGCITNPVNALDQSCWAYVYDHYCHNKISHHFKSSITITLHSSAA